MPLPKTQLKGLEFIARKKGIKTCSLESTAPLRARFDNRSIEVSPDATSITTRPPSNATTIKKHKNKNFPILLWRKLKYRTHNANK